MKTVKEMRVVIASPSDVNWERSQVVKAIEKANTTYAQEKQVRLESSMWETDDYPNFHPLGPQGHIDEQLGIPDCDIIIGIFWTRFGTPCLREKSGTAHELRVAYKNWQKVHRPAIMVYFCERPMKPAKTEEENLQRGEIVKFKKSFPKEGTWWSYKTREQFKDIIDRHLYKTVIGILESSDEASSDPSENQLPTTATILEKALNVDRLCLQSIRSMRDASEFNQHQIYRSIFENAFHDYYQEMEHFLRNLSGSDFAHSLKTGLSEPALVAEIAQNFQRIRFYKNDLEVVVNNPKLFWDCTCAFVDQQDQCPIHSHKLGRELSQYFKNSLVSIVMPNHVQLLWRDLPEFFPPAIDVYGLLYDLERSRILQKSIESVWDMGCGTGALGISICKSATNVRRVCFSDWLLTPLIYSSMNFHYHSYLNDQLEAEFALGMAEDVINPSRNRAYFDLLICNPPYLPLGERFYQVASATTTGGTELLEEVIRKSSSVAKYSVVSFSNLAFREATEAARSSGTRLLAIGPQGGRKYPFRVPEALAVPNYIEALITERGLEHREGEPYPYWHTVQSYLVEKI